MVHKKSEYELQFQRLSTDIRAEIWRENSRFREALKHRNLSDHYWRYQLIDEDCDCDKNSEKEVEPKRLRDVPNELENDLILYKDRGIQTSDELQTDQGPNYCKEFEGRAQNKSSPDIEPQTRAESAEPLLPNRTLEDHSHSNHKNTLAARSNNLKEDQAIFQKDRISGSKTQSQNFVHSHLNPSPTRSALKFYHSKHRTEPIFGPFGWNDSDKDVGQKKTHNVRAPNSQVYQSALLASGKRLAELESHFAEQLRKRRQHNSLIWHGPVNLSSIWMTEYQESFSKGKREPLLRCTYAKPIVWRHT